MSTEAKKATSYNWVKNVYYYLVMFVSIIFLCIGLFGLIKTTYLVTLAPKLIEQELGGFSLFGGYYGGVDACTTKYDYSYSENGSGKEMPINEDDCKKQTAEKKDLWIQREYLNSFLFTLIPTLVIVIHYFVFKQKS